MSSPFITDAEEAQAVRLVSVIEDAIAEFFDPEPVSLPVAIRAVIVVLAFKGAEGQVDADIFIAEVGAVLRALLTEQEVPNGPRSSH